MGYNSYDSSDNPAQAAVQAAFEADMRLLVGKFELYAGGNLLFGRKLLRDVVHPAIEWMEAFVSETKGPTATSGRAEQPAAEARGGPERLAERLAERIAEPMATVVKLDRRRTAAPSAHPGAEVQTFILDVLFNSDGALRVEDIQSHLESFEPPISPANLSVILHRMVRSGQLHRPGRGLYAPGPRAAELSGEAATQRP